MKYFQFYWSSQMESLEDEQRIEEEPDSTVRIFGKLYSTFPSIIDIFDDEVSISTTILSPYKLK
jgi:hypothetical protein